MPEERTEFLSEPKARVLPSGSEELLALEREKWELERQLRLRELQIREREAAAARWRSPVIVAIVAAALAGIGNVGVSYVNARGQLTLEAYKAEQGLVTEAIKTGGDGVRAAANLRFLASAGLLARRGPEILAALEATTESQLPSLPTLGVIQNEEVRSFQACVGVATDGFAGPETRRRIIEFQLQQGLPATGELDPGTWDKMREFCS